MNDSQSINDAQNINDPQKTKHLKSVKKLLKKKCKFLHFVSGKTLGSDDEFIEKLKEWKPYLKEVSDVEECEVILFFCPVISRAGTDIEAAVQKLQGLSDSKPAVLVVLHHTNNPEFTAPESSRNVTRENTLTVDCLFHEDKGLLHCQRNQRALDDVKKWMKQVKKQKKSQPGFISHHSQNKKLESEVQKLKRENEALKAELAEYKKHEKQKDVTHAVMKEGPCAVVVTDMTMLWVDEAENSESNKKEKEQAGTNTQQCVQQRGEGGTKDETYDWSKIQRVHSIKQKNTPQSERTGETAEGGDGINYKKHIKEIRKIYGTKTDEVMVIIPKLEHVIWVPKAKMQEKE